MTNVVNNFVEIEKMIKVALEMKNSVSIVLFADGGMTMNITPYPNVEALEDLRDHGVITDNELRNCFGFQTENKKNDGPNSNEKPYRVIIGYSTYNAVKEAMDSFRTVLTSIKDEFLVHQGGGYFLISTDRGQIYLIDNSSTKVFENLRGIRYDAGFNISNDKFWPAIVTFPPISGLDYILLREAKK